MKHLILHILAVLVLLLASGGDHVSNMFDQAADVSIEAFHEADEQETPLKQHFLSADIFNFSIQISHIIFHSDLLSEFELPLIAETKAHSVIETALNYTKHYRTLFRRIISPNAP